MFKAFSIILGGVALLCSAGAGADELSERSERSRQAIKQFAGALQAELKAAMSEGGPINAIGVCNLRAPAIASGVSADSGMRIGRTSLKLRNQTNRPDPWERAVLESFEQRKAQGEKPEQLEHAEVVERDGRREFRYMKAIPTAELCTRCHGEQLDPAVSRKLDELYPADQARGFKPGDIRGAFSVAQPM